MSTRRLTFGAAGCLLIAAALLALAAALDSPAIAVTGTVFAIGALVAREVWRWREYGPLWRAVTAAAAALAIAVLVTAFLIER